MIIKNFRVFEKVYFLKKGGDDDLKENDQKPTCKHGMAEEFCALCNPREKSRVKRVPKGRKSATERRSAVKPKEYFGGGYVLINTKRRGKRLNVSFDQLGSKTTFVHIHGHLYIWALKEIIKKCPNLRKVQVILKKEQRLTDTHRKLCESRGIKIIFGHWRPDLAWKEERIISPHYKEQRKFLLSLGGEQRELFDELLDFGFECALITKRYFCLEDEDFIPQRELAKEYGYKDEMLISLLINTVLLYLDPLFESSKESQAMSLRLKDKVIKLRDIVASQAKEQKFWQNLGVEGPPQGLRPSRYELYVGVLKAHQSGKIDDLWRTRARLARVIRLRFGFDKEFKRCFTLEEIGRNFFGGLTRERIRQLEEDALSLLGISSTLIE